MRLTKVTYFLATLGFILALGLATERQAYAYADPGSGLLVFQSLSAIVSGSLFYFRKRLKSLISKTKSDEKSR